MRLRKILALASAVLVLSALVANSYYLAFLFPYGSAYVYHERYEQLSQVAQQDNAVVVSVNARLIWVLSQFKVDVIDLAELANARNIDNSSAQLLGSWIRNYLQSGRTVLYLVTIFELTHASEYGNFKNDFSFFRDYVLGSFNSTISQPSLVPSPEYVLKIST